MKKTYIAPSAEIVELLHGEVLMTSDYIDKAEEKDNIHFETSDRQWNSESWSDVEE